MWTREKCLLQVLALYQESMYRYDKQWRESGYHSTIAYNCLMHNRNRAMAVKTELRAIRKAN